MAKAKATTVTLECPALGISRQFGASHAERLLGMHNNGGWALPPGSGYEYSREYGLRRRKHKEEDSGKRQG